MVDDNLEIEKQTLVNVDVISGKSFSRIIKNQRSEILIIVCNQTLKTVNIITKKLKLAGAENKQIINILY